MKRILLPLTLLLLLPLASAAQTTRYVSDSLSIPLRTGQSVQHKILKMLPSGTPLQVMETGSDGSSRVRTSTGQEGWVLTRYLDSTPSARSRLEQVEQKLATLELEDTRLKEELKRLTEQKNQAESTHQSLRDENQRLHQELDTLRQTAANAIEIDQENKELKSRLIELERGRQTLQQENATLKDRTARDWFMTGAAVALLSILVSLMLPKVMRWRQRSRWETL